MKHDVVWRLRWKHSTIRTKKKLATYTVLVPVLSKLSQKLLTLCSIMGFHGSHSLFERRSREKTVKIQGICMQIRHRVVMTAYGKYQSLRHPKHLKRLQTFPLQDLYKTQNNCFIFQSWWIHPHSHPNQPLVEIYILSSYEHYQYPNSHVELWIRPYFWKL